MSAHCNQVAGQSLDQLKALCVFSNRWSIFVIVALQFITAVAPRFKPISRL